MCVKLTSLQLSFQSLYRIKNLFLPGEYIIFFHSTRCLVSIPINFRQKHLARLFSMGMDFIFFFFSFLSSISVLTMRLLQDSSRPLCFWLLHQSWSSRCSSLSGLPWHCPSRSSSVSLCFSFPLHVHVKLHLVIFSPPSFPRVQTTVISFSSSFLPLFFHPQPLLLFVHF